MGGACKQTEGKFALETERGAVNVEPVDMSGFRILQFSTLPSSFTNSIFRKELFTTVEVMVSFKIENMHGLSMGQKYNMAEVTQANPSRMEGSSLYLKSSQYVRVEPRQSQ
jgi:hypothetical protein